MAAEVETIIRYDGPALAGHEMDIEELAPALLALASLIQTANHKLNGDRSAVRVVVNADLEQRCFQLEIKSVQAFLEKAKSFLDGDDVATIKTICEWIDLVGGSSLSLFKVLVALGRKREDCTVFRTEAFGDATVLNIQELHLHLDADTPEPVREMLQDKAIVAKAQEVMRPLIRKGYNTVGFHEPGGPAVFTASKEDAEAVMSLPVPEPAPEPQAPEGEPTFATGPAWVDTSHFRGSAKWGLLWNGIKIDAKMPDEFLQRFQDNELLVVPNAKLTVRMKIVPKVDERGLPLGLASFIVEEVLSVELPPMTPQQVGLFDEDA